MEAAMIDFTLIWDSLPALLYGTFVSLKITCVAMAIGLTLGSLFGVLESSKYHFFRFVIGIYVTLFRGTPMLVQILFVFYVFPQFGLNLPPFWAASLAIGLNSAAYISQIVRAGINAVSIGQVEAARNLGFSSFKTMRYIVLPQAFRTTLPALGNEMVTLIKDSSLASIIGVMELTKEASLIRSRTYDAFSILLAISIIYLILTSTLSLFLKRFEGELKHHVQS